MTHPILRLKKNEEKRLRRGHLWIFSNEIDTALTPLDGFSPGDTVDIADSQGTLLGTAYVNPNSLICARLVSRKPSLELGPGFFRKRIAAALALRRRLFDKPYYRLVYGESDGLPGLVIDRFGEVLALQIGTAGMERHRTDILTALHDLLSPRVMVLKNQSSLRQLEGLNNYTEVVHGALIGPVEIEENHHRFLVDVLQGQKSGWFFDHRRSRAQLARLASGRVLDLFCYTGAFGIPAAAAAAEVTCVDASQPALALAAENAKLNGVETRIAFVHSDVFDFLRQAREDRCRYDVIVLDPPALIKRKKDHRQGVEAYRRLNQMALQVLAKDGILVSASCSYHLERETLREILRAEARHIDRHLLLFDSGGQGADHPVHPAISETEYLKIFFCAVTASL